MSELPAPDDYANPRSRAEQRLATARMTVGRFTARKQQLDDLLARLTTEGPGFHVPLERLALFDNYALHARALFAFYEATFRGDFVTEHTASRRTEHRLKVNHGRYTFRLEPLAKNAAAMALRAVRDEWRVLNGVEALGAARPIVAYLRIAIDRVDMQREHLEAVDPRHLSADLEELINEHQTYLAAELADMRETLMDSLDIWQRRVPQQEYVFMESVQAGEDVATADVMLNDIVKSFDYAMAQVSDILARDALVTVHPSTAELLSANSTVARHALELGELQRLASFAAEVELYGLHWLDALDRAADAVRHLPTITETVELKPLNPTKATSVWIFAHSDDELTAGAGALATRAQSENVVLISATNGEAGRQQGLELDTPWGHHEFTELRERDQVRAAQALGIARIERAGLIDAGMPTEPSHHHLRLANEGANFEHLVAVIHETLEATGAKEVFTHPVLDEQTTYGHDDHRLTHLATIEAVGRLQREHRHDRGWTSPSVYAVNPEFVEGSDFAVVSNLAGEQANKAAHAAFRTQIPEDAPIHSRRPHPRPYAFVDVTPSLDRAAEFSLT